MSHHLQPPCCPYRCRNRKPFRAAGRGRPAGASGRRTRWSGPPSPQIEVRTEEPSTLVTTATSAQAQPSTELRGRRGKCTEARARGAADPATRAPARTAAPHTLWSSLTGPRLRQASAACWAALTAAPALSAAALTCNRTPAAVGRVLGAERGRQTAHSRRWGRCDGGFADAPVVAPSRAGNRPSPQLRRCLAPGLRSLPS